MSVGRRGFLSLFGLGVAGATMIPDLPKWLIYEPEKLALGGEGATSLATLTQAFADQCGRLMAGTRLWSATSGPSGEAFHRVGDKVRSVTLDSQRHVAFTLTPCEEIDLQARYLTPATEAMAYRIKHDRLNVFGVPELVPGSEIRGHVARRNGLAVRGLLIHDDLAEKDYVRFDVLGGRA